MNNRNTVLFNLCESGDINGVKNFLKQGGNIFQKFRYNETALHVACRYGHRELVKLLVERGFPINKPIKDCAAPLWLSVHSKDIVEILFKNGADLNIRDRNYITPLHIASKVGRVDVVKFFIENGAVYSKDIVGETPLHKAANDGNLDVIKFFLDIGYFHSPKSKLGQTPLHYAVKTSQLNVVKFLISRGADPNHETNPLFSSWNNFGNDKKEIFKIFIERGHMPDTKSFYTDELKEIFMNFFKIPKIYLLFCAREKNVDSHFYKDSLPFDLFKEIFKLTRSFCLEHEWNTFLKNAK